MTMMMTLPRREQGAFGCTTSIAETGRAVRMVMMMMLMMTSSRLGVSQVEVRPQPARMAVRVLFVLVLLGVSGDGHWQAPR
jgi:hypothetical protein